VSLCAPPSTTGDGVERESNEGQRHERSDTLTSTLRSFAVWPRRGLLTLGEDPSPAPAAAWEVLRIAPRACYGVVFKNHYQIGDTPT
jgi:hypothetical protein